MALLEAVTWVALPSVDCPTPVRGRRVSSQYKGLYQYRHDVLAT